MNASRLLLHADDFGMSPAVNRGILDAFRRGLLTSTSLLANAPHADEAIDQWPMLLAQQAAGSLPSAAARRTLDDPAAPFDLGVHLNLTQGRPLTAGYPTELLDAEGRFCGVFSLFAQLRHRGEKLLAAIRAELESQVRRLVDRGLRPTHLNGHQYIEMMPPVASLVPEIMERFGIAAARVAWEPSPFRTTALRRFQFLGWPLARVKRHFAGRFRRRLDRLGIAHPDAFFGASHAGRIDLPLLRLFLACAGERRVVEVALHPAEADEPTSPRELSDGWRDPLAQLRPGELAMLASPDLPSTLDTLGWRLGRLASRTA